MLNRFFFIILATALAGCASSYKPSSEMLHLKQGLDKQQAAALVGKLSKPSKGNAGFCGGGVTFDIGTPLVVTPDGYSLQAYRAGELLSSEKLNSSTTRNFYKKIYYRASRQFDGVTKIRVQPSPYLIGICNESNNFGYIVSLYYSTADLDAFAIADTDLDGLMAALSVLAPQAKLIRGVGL